ncbi:AtpZ/AtpI family protein [Oryzibacter oryziterrae]|uniref:AtpZ/AtpI family protein n=1 Tax=Oryzibacter oryziterrae TaxID=2766474 RepID=UPI001F1C78A7|nr:AtpZ/AtpI family protein [Oryzibacter oryziterrae]
MTSDDKRRETEGLNEGKPPIGSGDARLDKLREKLDDLKQTPEVGAGQTQGGMGGIGQAVKMGSEFVAGVIVGFVIGYTIDQVFGTKPWGMIVFLLLGFAAGTLNVLRAVGAVTERFPSSGQSEDKDKR